MQIAELEQKYEEKESECKDLHEMISNNELKYAEELDRLHDELALKREEVMRLREVEKELTFYKGKAEGVDGLR